MRNAYEVKLFGMRRSGTHAVIQWIAGHFPSPVWFLNNIESFNSPIVRQKDESGIYDPSVYLNPTGVPDFLEMPKETFIDSYEDVDLSTLDFDANQAVMGESRIMFSVLVVRDPLNLFASRLTKYYTGSIITANSRDVQLWKQHAREALGQTNFLRNKVVVNYNRWFLEGAYRRQIERELGLGISDKEIHKIAGIGSSFDPLTLDAQKMKVMERWRVHKQNPDFLSIVVDGEVRDLYVQLFGDSPEGGVW